MPFDIQPTPNIAPPHPGIPRNIEDNHRVKAETEQNITQIANELLPESDYLRYEVNPETNERIAVVDLEKLKNSFVVNDDGHRFRYKGTRVATSKIAKAIFERHKELECISTVQYENNDFTPKPLFYYPESVRGATHRLTIRQADYHFALWELLHENAINLRHERFTTKDGQSVSMLEAKTGIVLFHDLDGQRDDETGRLYIKNPEYDSRNKQSKKIVPISRDLIRMVGLNPLVVNPGEESRLMRESLMADCPNLLVSGALRLDDFREITLSNGDEKKHNFSPKKVGKNGYVMLHGVNHYVGRRFEGASAVPFDGESALVVEILDGKEVIHGIFSLVDKEAVRETTYVNPKNGNAVPRANAELTKLQEIDYQNFVVPGYSAVLTKQQQREIEVKVKLAIDQLVAVANQAESLIVDTVEGNAIEFQKEVRKAILKNAKQLLMSIAQASNTEVVQQLLENFSIEARAFVTILQQIGVDKMIRQPLDTIPAQQLTEADREQMRQLIQENYRREHPGEINQKFRELVIRSLENSFQQSNTDFYILRDGDQIVSFNRFDKITNKETGRNVLYFGSFNASQKYRGVGSFMLERTIQEKLGECDAMMAHCDPTSAVSRKYIEDGFLATQTETVEGKFSFEIWRTKDSSQQLKTKQMSEAEIISLAGEIVPAYVDYFVREVETNDQFLELDRGLAYLLTRYFTVGGKTYAAFEINTSLSQQFVLPTAK